MRLMAVERRPVIALEDQKKQLSARSDAWRDVTVRLNNLQQRAATLRDAATFGVMVAAVENTTLARVQASSSAQAGTYCLEVTQLAQAHVVAGGGYASPTTALSLEGTASINGSELVVGPSDTLYSIADRINALDAGVRAAVVRVGDSDYRLTLTASSTGAASEITLEDGGGVLLSLGLLVEDPGTGTLAANTVSAAQDALFTLNGLSMSRSSNSVTDAVQGLSLNLTATGSTTITVSRGIDYIVGAVRGFVEQYNSTFGFIKQQTAVDGALRSEPALRQLASRLPGLVVSPVAGATGLTRASEVGLTTAKYGSGMEGYLELDETKLRTQLNDNFEAVVALFGARRTNVAAGATATASSELGGVEYAAANAVNGTTSSELWGTSGGGWCDGTADSFPDTLEIDFGTTRTIDSVTIYTLNSSTYPASDYGIRDWWLEYHDGTTWQLLGEVTGNTTGTYIHTFDAVSTDRIRIQVQAANGANDHSRIVEVEAYQKNDGIGTRLRDAMRAFTTSATGTASQRQTSIQNEITRLEAQIARFELRLEQREETMRKRFLAMEEAMALMQTQEMWLNQQLKWLSPSRK
jgi:flagellar hook-associated protein 2